MNGMEEQNQTGGGDSNESSKPVAFCQHCGKPLSHETKRAVGAAVYCEPCLAARLAGDTAYPGAGAAQGFGPVNTVAGVPIPTGEPNPGLAALLGLIPGVGAMYNEQYAKGIVHLVIFAVLVSFSHVTGIFVMFVFGWLAYMSIEAHHTAKARRDGTPLPNPFGLNDVGERMGFGKAWPGAPNVAAVARDAAETAAAGFGSMHPGFAPGPGAGTAAPFPSTATPSSAAASGPNWGAPVDAYPQTPGTSPQFAGAAHAPPGYAQAYAQGYGQAQSYPYGTHAAYGPPFASPLGSVPPLPPLPLAQNRFPAGAIWLIGLGTLFLLGTTGVFRFVSAGVFVGFLLIALGVWVFVRRMTDTGLGLGDDGSANYQLRLVRALKPSMWLLLLGILSLLNEYHWLRWEYSWPWIVILAGVMMLLNRAAYNSAATAMYAPAVSTAATPQPASPGAGITPAEHTEPDLPQGGK